MRRAATLLLVLVFLAAAQDSKRDPNQIGNRDVGKGVNFYSLEKEIALGRQLAQEVEREAKLVDDPIVAEFVNRLGQNIARHSDARVPCTFKVIESDVLNAFALPGGFIFVNSGLLKVAETEAELASAMSHEVAHVAGRHMTRQATRSQIVEYLTLPLAIAGGWTGYAVRQAAGVGIPITFLKFDRIFESEADLLGLQYLYAAGYDPTAAVDLFEKMQSLERRKPGTIAQVFASHPLTGTRLKQVQKDIGEILPRKPEYVISTSEYMEVRSRLLGATGRRAPAPDGPVLRRREWVE